MKIFKIIITLLFFNYLAAMEAPKTSETLIEKLPVELQEQILKFVGGAKYADVAIKNLKDLEKVPAFKAFFATTKDLRSIITFLAVRLGPKSNLPFLTQMELAMLWQSPIADQVFKELFEENKEQIKEFFDEHKRRKLDYERYFDPQQVPSVRLRPVPPKPSSPLFERLIKKADELGLLTE